MTVSNKVDIRPLKQNAQRMDDSQVKNQILSLPDEISKEELFIKMDLILPFLDGRKKEEKRS